jgi:hypothetical protein
MKKGYKIVSPGFLGNAIVESKNAGYNLAKSLDVKKSELKFKRYSW